MAGTPEKKSGGGQSRSAAGDFNPWAVAVIVSIATFMEVLDTSIANVALPHIAGSLSASLDESTWVLTSYLVSNAIVLPISGWLSAVIGRKRFYMMCVALFGVSSLLCGLAPSLGWLVAFRVLQGIGGGGLAPSEQSLLTDTFPPEKRSQAFALYSLTVVVAPTLGPTLGGWITDNYSWHWIFLINVPVCILSVVLCGWVLNDPPAVRKETEKLHRKGINVDYLGIILIALGLGCLQVVLDRGQRDDWWDSDFIIIFALISAVSLVAFLFWEFASKDPVVDVHLAANRSFAAALLMMFVTGFIILSTTQLLPQFLQTVMGYDATRAGLALSAGGLVTLVVAPVIGNLLKVVQPRDLIIAGLIIEALACYHMRGFNSQVSFSHVAWARTFQAIGFPMLFISVTTASYAGLPPGKSANASALVNSMRNLGASFGISVATTLLARRSQFHQSRLAESVTRLSVNLQSHGSVAMGGLRKIVEQQALMWSYIDAFWLVSVCAAAVIPLAFLFRRAKPGTAAH